MKDEEMIKGPRETKRQSALEGKPELFNFNFTITDFGNASSNFF